MMLQAIEIIFLIFSFFYFSVIILIITGLLRLRNKLPQQDKTISVVIAARNEEKRITATLDSLEKLVYPADKFEIIFVDDDSVDKTAEMIASRVRGHSNWQLIRLQRKDSELTGKKRALREGIDKARGELILTTDADCQVPKHWLGIMSAYFDDKTVMVLGHSPLKTGKGLGYRILEFDNLFSAIVGAAPTKMGFAITSVGRNLAYRKSAYLHIGGFAALKKFKSGDDVHLTEKIREKNIGRIDYCAHPDSFVLTMPPSTKREIFHQQIRKNSKTLKKSLPSIGFSLLLFIVFVLFYIFPVLQPTLFNLWLKVLLLKFVLEFLTLFQATLIFKKTYLLFIVPVMQIFYPFYIMFFSLLGLLQRYEWKK